MNIGDRVYVRWYGKVVEGKLLDGELLGMKPVQISLDGRKVVALFTPQHVYEKAADVMAVSPTVNVSIQRVIPSTEKPSGNFFQQQYLQAKERLEEFKRDNWDAEKNHLRIDKLDEYYELWKAYAHDLYINYPKHPFVPEWNGWDNGIQQSVGETMNKAIKELKGIFATEADSDYHPEANAYNGGPKPEAYRQATPSAPKPCKPAKKITVTQLSLFD